MRKNAEKSGPWTILGRDDRGDFEWPDFSVIFFCHSAFVKMYLFDWILEPIKDKEYGVFIYCAVI